MVFREAQRTSVTRVLVGPFGPRWGRLAMALGAVVVFGPLALFSALHTTLRCDRPAGAVRCVVSRSAPLLPPRGRVLDRADIVTVLTQTRAGSRRGSTGSTDVVIRDARGTDVVVATRSDADDAERVRADLQAFLDGASVASLQVDTPPGVASYGLAAFGLVTCTVLLLFSFGGAGRLVIEVDPAADEIRVVRTVLGLRRGGLRARLADVADVLLEHGPVADPLRSRNQQPLTGGRLVLIDRGGMHTPVDAVYRRQLRTVERGFAALRVALQLPRIEPPTPPLPPRSGPSPWRTLRIVLPVFALVIGAAFALNVVLDRQASRTQGWLEIRAENRCRFDGAELLPSGMMRMAVDPGDYSIDVWVQGRWEQRHATVRVGEQTVFVCRP